MFVILGRNLTVFLADISLARLTTNLRAAKFLLLWNKSETYVPFQEGQFLMKSVAFPKQQVEIV